MSIGCGTAIEKLGSPMCIETGVATGTMAGTRVGMNTGPTGAEAPAIDGLRGGRPPAGGAAWCALAGHWCQRASTSTHVCGSTYMHTDDADPGTDAEAVAGSANHCYVVGMVGVRHERDGAVPSHGVA